MTTDTIPDDAAIQAMDGQALTLLVWQLGLAPSEACHYDHKVWIRVEGITCVWAPSKDIQHAEALLRQMRQCGFWTGNEGATDGGVIMMMLLSTGEGTSWKRWWSIEPRPSTEPSECLAILRCCCLARAAQLREGHACPPAC